MILIRGLRRNYLCIRAVVMREFRVYEELGYEEEL